MKLSDLKQLPFEIVAAFVTWLTVAGLAIYVMIENNRTSFAMMVVVVLLLLIFIASFLQSTGEAFGHNTSVEKYI
jgi:FtsH-binding integral membrane protein